MSRGGAEGTLGPASELTAATTPGPRWVRLAFPFVGMRVLGQGLEFAAWVVLARRLGTAGFGGLSVAFLACRYAGLVADWGASVRGARDVVSEHHAATVPHMVRRRAAVGAGLCLAYVAGTLLAGHPALAPLGLTIVARGVARDWLALGRGRGALSGAPSALQGGVAVALALVASTAGAGALAIGVAYSVAAAASVLVNRLPSRDAPPAAGGRRSVNAWVLAAVLADQVSISFDTILLAALRSTSVAGIYAAVYRLPNAWATLVGLLVAGLVPVSTRAAGRDRAMFQALTRRSLRIAGVAAAALAALAPVAYLMVPLIFGKAYEPGRVPLVILLAAMAATTAAAPLQPVYLALGRDRDLGVLSMGGAGLSLLGYLILIPVAGAEGAATATLIAQMAMLVALRVRVRDALPLRTRRA